MRCGSLSGRERVRLLIGRRPLIDQLEQRVLMSGGLASPGGLSGMLNDLVVPQIAPATIPDLEPAAPRGYVPPAKQVATRIIITPTGLSLADGTSFQYAATAYDQNGNLITVAPAFSWSVMSGGAGGSINSAGVFTAPAGATGASTIQVAAGTAKATAIVNLTSAGVLTADSDIGAP
jgi:hypothetical protein